MLLRVAIISILSLYGWTAYSYQGWENDYWGTISCGDWEWVKQDYKDYPENHGAQYTYATCLFIKGKLTNNSSEVDLALRMLYHLAEDFGDITASNFMAGYLKTDGTMKNFGFDAGIDNIDRSIYYYQRVLYLIALTNGHYATPGDEYRSMELNEQMELQSYMTIPYIYLQKYFLGVIGDDSQKLLASPSYEGDRDLDTYPEYADLTLDSLSQMKESAQTCLSLPYKAHFKRPAYNIVRELCQNYKQLAESLYELELKRKEEIVQDYCKDILSPSCPINSIMEDIQLVLDEDYENNDPILHGAWKALWGNNKNQFANVD